MENLLPCQLSYPFPIFVVDTQNVAFLDEMGTYSGKFLGSLVSPTVLCCFIPIMNTGAKYFFIQEFINVLKLKQCFDLSLLAEHKSGKTTPVGPVGLLLYYLKM